MRRQFIHVTFQPAGKTVRVSVGMTLREAADQAGIRIEYPCGGQGSCGKCKVRLTEPPNAVTPAERTLLSPEALQDGVRLACQRIIDAPVTVEIPERPLDAEARAILEWSALEAEPLIDPPVRSEDFVAADTQAPCFTAAFDIGTTTLCGVLIDISTGHECARTSCANPQARFGEDVLSRITFATQNAEGLDRLNQEVINAVNGMIEELARQAGVAVERVCEISLAGNTAMQHLLAGEDPTSLGYAPFLPVLQESLLVPAANLGISIHSRARAYVFPVIGGFVGGDTVAGILATGLDTSEGPTLFLDIGTNGEIVICSEGHLVATSCAAGPAFEGARITHGMRAARGAIEAVRLGDDVSFCVIGNAPPASMCGSAMIDLLADLLRHGLLSPDGRLSGPDEVPSEIPARIRERVIAEDGETGFVVIAGEQAASQGPITLYQRDIRELQLAIGAIRAGIAIMLSRAGLAATDLDRVLVGGAFGNYIRCENAQRIGLLPADVNSDRIVFLGNTALAGARRAAVSQSARDRAAQLARKTEHIDLSTDPRFQDTFVEAMRFPATEAVSKPSRRSG